MSARNSADADAPRYTIVLFALGKAYHRSVLFKKVTDYNALYFLAIEILEYLVEAVLSESLERVADKGG